MKGVTMFKVNDDVNIIIKLKNANILLCMSSSEIALVMRENDTHRSEKEKCFTS